MKFIDSFLVISDIPTARLYIDILNSLLKEQGYVPDTKLVFHDVDEEKEEIYNLIVKNTYIKILKLF